MSKAANVLHYTKQLSPLKPIKLKPLPRRPLVSILISSYNYGRYLSDAVESVIHQAYQNWELIICDDGSTDSSREIAERYKSRDSRVKLIYQVNSGQSLALNAAFRQSAGDIICFLDADDIFLPDKVRRVADALAVTPDSGFAVHKMLLVDKARKHLGGIPCLYGLPSGWQAAFLSSSGPRVLPGLPPTSGLSLHRSAAEALFPLPGALKAYSDTLIQVVAPLVTPIVAIDVPLSEYRVHGANVGGVSRFTEDRLRNIVLYERVIWSAWCRYLSSSRSGIPSDFPLPTEMAPSVMDYAYARFRSGQDFKAVYQAIPQAYFESLARPLRWYWRASNFLPRWFFLRSFDFVYGQTRSKMVARSLVNALRNSVATLRHAPGPKCSKKDALAFKGDIHAAEL
jgi:glycosyltransferase involved in cell wall biosynthesis